MKNKFKFMLLSFFLVQVLLFSCASSSSSSPKEPEERMYLEWTEEASLKEAFVDSDIFEHIGFAVPLDLLRQPKIRTGLSRQVNSITMENDMKPQWLQWYFGEGAPSHTAEFTASNGRTIKVPDNIPSLKDSSHGLGGVATCLKLAKEAGIQMRGHTLTWHSQTFDWFFCEDYNISKGLVKDKEEMTARHEWYIKTVLEFVKNWEDENNDGKRIIYAWDVVNEAIADDASNVVYIRGGTNSTKNPTKIAAGCNSKGDSRWYQIYKSDEFLINAFRFANKYAPKDVALCYNDYNEYMINKTTGIENLLKTLIEHQNDAELPTRIDAMGMQSHLSSWVGIGAYETAIKKYLALGLDIHVTELDMAYSTPSNWNGKKLEDVYSDYFKLFRKYAKSAQGEHGITSVTLWGIYDEASWIFNGGQQQPLLFERISGKIYPKDAFYAVLDTAK